MKNGKPNNNNNMKKTILILTLFVGSIATSQSDKQINKAVKVFEKNYTKGIEKLDKYMSKANPKRLKAWNTRVEMEYLRYHQDKEVYKNAEISGDDISEEDREYFINYPFHRLVNYCRKATIIAESNKADYYLRKVALETLDTDTSFSEKAKDYFEEAQDFYDKKDYELAILNYKKAIKEEPNYYEAYIKIGTSFWNEEKIDSALKYYNLAKPVQPSYVEPYSYIISLLMDEELYHRAKKECLEALCVYPGFDIKLKYLIVLNKEEKYMDEHRIYRYFYPNKIGTDQDEVNGVMSVYREAKDKISKYCNDDGIIEENGITKEKYLEVYSWKKALEEMDDVPDFLKFAEQMNEDGYLDCYVLISLYHYDFYPQVKDFLSYKENKEKVKEYITKYLIKGYED